MPTREYVCERCNGNFEEFFSSISADHPAKCPDCGEAYGEVFRQVYHGGIGLVKGEPKTFGQQAESNAKRLGKEGMRKLKEEDRTRYHSGGFTGELPQGGSAAGRPSGKSASPWYRSGKIPGLQKMDKPLDLSKVKDTTKYVRTGETG